jgi:hypothetical protein
MLRLIALYALSVAASVAVAENFDAARPGSLPLGWTAALTGEGGPPSWQVAGDPSAPSKPNVLAQTSNDKTSRRFPLAVYEKATLRDGEVSVRFKPVSGTVDQAAGIVWRYRDAGNYYIVRANALENNVVLYKVENGKRIPLAPKDTPAKTYGMKHTVPGRTWSQLAVSFRGQVFSVSFNGEKLFEVEDGTFTEAGRVGLWTEADSVTYFDDFQFSGR